MGCRYDGRMESMTADLRSPTFADPTQIRTVPDPDDGTKVAEVVLRSPLGNGAEGWDDDYLRAAMDGRTFDHGGWWVEARLVHEDDHVRVKALTFTPPPDGDTMLSLGRQLRAMRLADVQKAWEHLYFNHVERELPDEWRRGALTSNRAGRRGHPPVFYAKWAQRYEAAVTDADTRSAPMKALVAEYPVETANSIGRYLRKAEALGFLAGRGGQGKAGGHLTEHGRRVLDQTDGAS